MKRLGYIISVLVLILTLSSCKEETKEIAVLLYDLEDPFIRTVSENLLVHNATPYKITIYDCQNSQIVQNEKAEKLYEEGVDLLVINPVDRLSSYIFVEKSKKEGVPTIFFNREPLREDLESMDEAYYVGADATESGLMQADMIAEYFNYDTYTLNGHDKNGDGIIQCVILKGEQGHQDAEERTRAVVNGLEQKGFDVEVLVTKIANWNESFAYRSMDELMELYGDDIELLISNNDAMAIGASKYLKDHHYYGDELEGVVSEIPFPVVAIDGLEEAIELIEKGYMLGTIINDGDNMAKAIVQLAQYVLEGNKGNLDYELVDNRYIWISYKNHSKE